MVTVGDICRFVSRFGCRISFHVDDTFEIGLGLENFFLSPEMVTIYTTCRTDLIIASNNFILTVDSEYWRVILHWSDRFGNIAKLEVKPINAPHLIKDKTLLVPLAVILSRLLRKYFADGSKFAALENKTHEFAPQNIEKIMLYTLWLFDEKCKKRKEAEKLVKKLCDAFPKFETLHVTLRLLLSALAQTAISKVRVKTIIANSPRMWYSRKTIFDTYTSILIEEKTLDMYFVTIYYSTKHTCARLEMSHVAGGKLLSLDLRFRRPLHVLDIGEIIDEVCSNLEVSEVACSNS